MFKKQNYSSIFLNCKLIGKSIKNVLFSKILTKIVLSINLLNFMLKFNSYLMYCNICNQYLTMNLTKNCALFFKTPR